MGSMASTGIVWPPWPRAGVCTTASRVTNPGLLLLEHGLDNCACFLGLLLRRNNVEMPTDAVDTLSQCQM